MKFKHVLCNILFVQLHVKQPAVTNCIRSVYIFFTSDKTII